MWFLFNIRLGVYHTLEADVHWVIGDWTICIILCNIGELIIVYFLVYL